MKIRLVIAAIALMTLFTATTTNAATLGKYCWTDSFSATWVISIADFGSENYSLNGYRKVSFACNGLTQQPITGTAVVVNSTTVSFGVMSNADQPDNCTSVTWHVNMNLNTLNATGSWHQVGASGNEGSFALTKISCPASAADINPTESLNDPSRKR